MAKKKPPSVRIACPEGRPLQLRYFCPIERKEIRISTGTRDRDEAEQKKRELEAKLLLGLDAKPKDMNRTRGPQMPWEDFREQYSRIYLSTLKAPHCAESRLDIAERIIPISKLSDLNSREALESLQAKLLAGEGQIARKGCKHGQKPKPAANKPRSAHTVKSIMAAIVAALNWAVRRGWLPSVPKIDKVKTAKLKAMKGRPITTEEFERMLSCTEEVVGTKAAESWRHVLRGLWSSGLRLEELMNVSWDDENAIRPIWQKRRLPVLYIPATKQKNETEEAIPLLPWFENLLLETPEDARTGWIFNPQSMHEMRGWKTPRGRPNPEWVGRIICRIGKKAGVIVHKGGQGNRSSGEIRVSP